MQVGFIPLLTIAAIAYVNMLRVPLPTKVALDSMILALVVIHIDLTDGGLLSRILYSVTSSYTVRGHLTVMFALVWATGFIVLADGWGGPLLSLYMVPIALAAARGGLTATLICAGLLGAGVVAGVFATKPAGGLTPVEIATLAMPVFAALVLGSIVGRLRRAAMDLSALYEAGRAIGASLKLDDTLPLVLNIVALELHADVGLLVLVDEETGAARIEAQRGLPPEVSGMALPSNDFITEYVVGRMHSVFISHRHAEPAVSIAPDFGSVLAVPLVVGGRPVGALVAGKYQEHAFRRDSIRFMEALASQAATAVENGRLFGEAHQWAVRDGLTGLYNYRYFANRFGDELARAARYGGAVSLIMIDVDLFKRVNDTWGHLEGDEVLRQIGQLLEHETRESDIVARYGGEEFAIILPQAHLEQALGVADKLRDTVARHHFSAVETSDTIHVTISCGVASYPEFAADAEALLRFADSSLYEAKVQRNTVRGALPRDGTPTSIAPPAAGRRRAVSS